MTQASSTRFASTGTALLQQVGALAAPVSRPGMSRRRFLAAGGAVATGLTLAACGSNTSATGTAGGSGGGGSTTELTLWGNHPEWADDLNALIGAFQQSHSGITVTATFKPIANYASALNTALAGGAAPDLIGLAPGGQVATLASSGQIADLTGKVDPANFLDESAQQVVINDKVWGAPLALPVVGKFFRPSIFTQAGIQVPTSSQDMVDGLRTLKQAGLGTYGMGGTDGFGPWDLYSGAVSATLGPDGFQDLRTGKIKLTDAKLLPAAQFLLDLGPYYQEGWLNASIAQVHDLYIQGKVSITAGGTSDLAGFRAATADIDAEMFPSFPPPGVEGTPVGLFGNELIYTVNAQSKNVDAAATFVGWLATAEAQQIVADRLSLPTIKGVVPADPVRKEMLNMTTVRMPVWWDCAELANCFPVFAQKGMPVFTEAISPAEMAQVVQDAITPSTA